MRHQPLGIGEQHGAGRTDDRRWAIRVGTLHAVPSGGAFHPPVVLTGVSATMAIADEEIFGPVAPVLYAEEGWTSMGGDRFERCLALRKEVLGAAYVENAMDRVDGFTRPMQELSTSYCWGEIWSRPGLTRRERSLLNLGMISALNRPHELRLHVKAALRNGPTDGEIREALLQVAVYCGIPAGIDSTRIAAEAIAEYEAELASGGESSAGGCESPETKGP